MAGYGLMALTDLGWDDEFAAAAAAADHPRARPGRVARVDFGAVTVWTESGTERAASGATAVATGDWVLIEPVEETMTVTDVLPRRTSFVRGRPMEGMAIGEQVVAANIDTEFIVHALNSKPNLRRLERELVLVYESGAVPVVVGNKADLADDPDSFVTEFETVAPGVDIVITSTKDGRGIDELGGYAHGGHTIALIGASGVGKSTLVNRLVGEDVQETQAVREGDQRGRHTTTARELVLLPSGGLLVDTPGLRAVSLWDADDGFAKAFADIEELAARCKFNDCSHTSEPGCAVRAAVESGELDRARFENYLRLDQELDAAARKREARIMSKEIKRFYKNR
jgi:ribosome biogenesis GTPase